MAEADRISEERISEDAAVRLAFAASVDDLHLAAELERLGISDEDSCLEDARKLRPIILPYVEAYQAAARGLE